MDTELTSEMRQRKAFDFLRDRARNAHIAGDGLLVNLLCHTGFQRLEELAKQKKLQLAFSDVAWMPIFAFYWLVNPSERYVIENAINELGRGTEEDGLVGQWVDRYRILVEQPLAGDAQLSPSLKDFPWPCFFAERSPEAETLLCHMVELVWFHGPSEEYWNQLAETWLQTAPVWTHRLLADLKARLHLQARLTSPSQPHALIPESEVEQLHAHNDIAELWMLHLHGRSAAVCEAAERLTPFLTSDSHRWRVLHDFIHFDSVYGPHEDSQGVRLARRRRLSVETPLLIFHDERQSWLSKALGEVFRARTQGAASKRWEIYMLAQLQELAALRLWDYGMWLGAIRAQAQANLEVVQWTDTHPDMSAQGLILAVRSFSASSPEKDATIRRAIDTLEFAPTEVLSALGESLLATYPKQKHSAKGLLQDLTDLLPSETWPGLARWTTAYIQESSEDRTSGWHLAPATHWLWVLPVLPPDSSVWAMLQPEALRMASSSLCWRSNYGKFLRRWILFSPKPLALEVVEAMTSHPETGSGERFARVEHLIEFEEWNLTYKRAYTSRLLRTAASASEAFVLAKHLEEADLSVRENTLREGVIQNVRITITHAAPQSHVKGFVFSPAMGVNLVNTWRLEDQPLLEELIAAVNSPNVVTEYLSWLFQTIQLLVANGPVEFAKFVQPHVTHWTHQLPRGRKAMDAEDGPLSIVQWNRGGEGEIALMLGWLAFQLPEKLGSESHSLVIAWARQMLLIGESEPLDLVIYCCAVVALQGHASTSAEPLSLMETAILSLSARVDHGSNNLDSLANALRKISYLINFEVFEVPVVAGSPSPVNAFVAVLARLIPRFAKSPHASLRSAVAAVVWQLEKHGRQEAWVKESLAALEQDHRARVRFEATGGWKEAHARAMVSSSP